MSLNLLTTKGKRKRLHLQQILEIKGGNQHYNIVPILNTVTPVGLIKQEVMVWLHPHLLVHQRRKQTTPEMQQQELLRLQLTPMARVSSILKN